MGVGWKGEMAGADAGEPGDPPEDPGEARDRLHRNRGALCSKACGASGIRRSIWGAAVYVARPGSRRPVPFRDLYGSRARRCEGDYGARHDAEGTPLLPEGSKG